MIQERMTIPEIIERIEGNFIKDSQNPIWSALLYLKELQELWPSIKTLAYGAWSRLEITDEQVSRIREFGERAGLND